MVKEYKRAHQKYGDNSTWLLGNAKVYFVRPCVALFLSFCGLTLFCLFVLQIQECPKCNVYIEKNGGCNWIKCQHVRPSYNPFPRDVLCRVSASLSSAGSAGGPSSTVRLMQLVEVIAVTFSNLEKRKRLSMSLSFLTWSCAFVL